ncbi:MAG: DNA polymerase IV [Acidimicrobiales bacterium]
MAAGDHGSAGPAGGAGSAGAGAAGELGILHVDMDAFFVAVETLAEPSLAGRPVIVGGQGNRGVVASCSYEARAYGIHSAMPSVRARRLCPEAVWIAGDYEAYSRVSRRLHEVLGSFTPLVEGIALDEAFLDVSGARRLFGPAEHIAGLVRTAVADQLRLDCSVGVARCKLLAKLASKAAKPVAQRSGTRPGAGVVVVEVDRELEFLHPLPVRALWGVGPATAARLDRFGVDRVGQLAQLPLDSLVATFGPAMGRQLHALAWARDDRPVEPGREVRSVSHEETYATDHSEAEFLHRQVVRMSDAVAARLRAGGRAGRTVTLKVRFGDFSTITRSRRQDSPVCDGPVIAKVAAVLLAGVDVSPGVRLLGVAVSGLSRRQGGSAVGGLAGVGPAGVGPSAGGAELGGTSAGGSAAGGALAEGVEPGGGRQLTLDEALTQGGWGAVSAVVDAARGRFGPGALGPASLARPGGDQGEAGRPRRGLDVKRVGDTQWGPDPPP